MLRALVSRQCFLGNPKLGFLCDLSCFWLSPCCEDFPPGFSWSRSCTYCKLKDQKFQAWWVRCRIPENVENFIVIPTFVRNKAWANRVFLIYDEKASKYRLSFCNLSPWTRSKTHKTSFWSSLCVAPNYYSITIDIKFNKTVSTFFLVGFILSSLEKTLLLFSLVTVPGSMFIVINFLDFLHLMTWVSR